MPDSVFAVMDRAKAEARSAAAAGRTLRVPPQVTAVIGEAVYPKATTAGALKREAAEMSGRTRAIMQRTIDQWGGSKSLAKGKMPRLALQQT